MAALRAPVSSPGDDFSALADLWIVGVNAPHDLGCACGGMAMPSIAASDIERDFLSYLAHKHRATADIAGLIEARMQNPSGPFERWIAGLGGAKLSSESRENLLKDFRTFLDSFSGRSRFAVCY